MVFDAPEPHFKLYLGSLLFAHGSTTPCPKIGLLRTGRCMRLSSHMYQLLYTRQGEKKIIYRDFIVVRCLGCFCRFAREPRGGCNCASQNRSFMPLIMRGYPLSFPPRYTHLPQRSPPSLSSSQQD